MKEQFAYIEAVPSTVLSLLNRLSMHSHVRVYDVKLKENALCQTMVCCFYGHRSVEQVSQAGLQFQ